MAVLMHSEAPKVLDPHTVMLQPWKKFFSQFFQRWVANDHSTSAAAIAFFVIFSLAPIIVFAVAIAGEILESDAGARQAAVDFFDSALGDTYGKAIVDQVKLSAFREATMLPTIFFSLIAVWSASATFMQLRKALNRINGFAAEGIRGSVLAVVLGRVRAALFSIGVGLLLALASLLSAWSHTLLVKAPLLSFIAPDDRDWLPMQVISWLTVLAVFYGMLRFLPMRRPPWREVVSGALIGTVLFQIGKYLIIAAAIKNVVAQAYATSTTLVITVMWIFLSAHVLLFAAEIGHMLFSPETSPFDKYRQKETAE